MFDVFGEFDSYMEINMAAEGMKEEGDVKSLRERYIVSDIWFAHKWN